MPDKIIEPPPHTAPAVFTRALLDWLPWLEPLAEESLTERQMAGLVDAVRAKSPYFRLLTRDPDALRARMLTDKDIFYNPAAGLPRGERELAGRRSVTIPVGQEIWSDATKLTWVDGDGVPGGKRLTIRH